MYSKGQTYKFELKKGIFYTGVILDEDNIQISIETIRGEKLILNKDEIMQSRLEK